MVAIAARPPRSFARDRSRAALAFAGPLLLLWGALLVLPIGQAVWYSLTSWDGFEANWVGLANYVTLSNSADFGAVVLNNIVLLLSVPAAVAIPFGIALLIAVEPPGWRVARALVFLPAALSWVVTGIVWLRFFAGDGILNAILRGIGLGALQMDLLGHVGTAILPVAIAFVWSQVGPNTLIFLVGLSSMDRSVLEAASIDGATPPALVARIVLPLMLRFVVFVVIITVLAAFTALFSLIFVMTGGGPGFSTTTMEFYVYRLAFTQTDFGMGAAVGVVLLLSIAAISIPLVVLQARVRSS